MLKTKRRKGRRKKKGAAPSEAEVKLAESALEEAWFGDEDPETPRDQAAKSMAAAAAIAVGLKPFPAIAQRAMTLLGNPNVNIQEVRKVIETDTALASRLMRIANSALFKRAYKTASIDQALTRIGLSEAREIVASVAMMGMFEDMRGLGADFRNHCTCVAAIVRVLATEWRFKGVDNAFLSGLMHDVGKLLSMQVGEISYEKMDAEQLAKADQIHVLEREKTGYDHAVLGGYVMRSWKLPTEVCQIVSWHHQPGPAFEQGGDSALTVALLRLANHIEYQLRQNQELDEAFVQQLATGGECAYTDMSADVLTAMWPKFVAACAEIQQVSAG